MTNSNHSRLISRFCALILLATLAPAKAQMTKAAPPDVQAKRSPVLAALQAELERSLKTLGTLDPPAYFIGYTVTDTQRVNVSGSNGALLNSDEGRNRCFQVVFGAGAQKKDLLSDGAGCLLHVMQLDLRLRIVWVYEHADQ